MSSEVDRRSERILGRLRGYGIFAGFAAWHDNCFRARIPFFSASWPLMGEKKQNEYLSFADPTPITLPAGVHFERLRDTDRPRLER